MPQALAEQQDCQRGHDQRQGRSGQAQPVGAQEAEQRAKLGEWPGRRPHSYREPAEAMVARVSAGRSGDSGRSGKRLMPGDVSC